MSTNWKYAAFVTTGAYVAIPVGFLAGHFMVKIASGQAESVQFSLDGTALDGEVDSGEGVAFDGRSLSTISFKSASGGIRGKFWAWTGE